MIERLRRHKAVKTAQAIWREAEELARTRGGIALNYATQLRMEARAKTGVDWGAMDPKNDPSPRSESYTTVPPTTTTAP